MTTSISRVFAAQHIGGTCIIRLSPMQIDPSNCDAVFYELLSFIKEVQPSRVVINMRKVEYLHSVAIGWLMALNREIMNYDGDLVVCSLENQARETLAITRVDRFFDICDSERAALIVA